MSRNSLDVERGECDGCFAKLPGWALYEVREDDPWYEAVCGACLMRHEAVDSATPDLAPWETEAGKYLKAQRNLALSFDQTGWVMIDDAPVTNDCREAFRAYRASLNRMTVDFLPDTWVWPEPPTLAYD